MMQPDKISPDADPFNSKSFRYLRTIALITLVTGAVVSLGFMYYTGRHNKSVFLMGLFAGWVLAPFIALFAASMISRPWLVPVRVPLYLLMLVITTGSVMGYSGLASLPGTKPAFMFLVIPLISWVLMAIVILTGSMRSRKGSG